MNCFHLDHSNKLWLSVCRENETTVCTRNKRKRIFSFMNTCHWDENFSLLMLFCSIFWFCVVLLQSTTLRECSAREKKPNKDWGSPLPSRLVESISWAFIRRLLWKWSREWSWTVYNRTIVISPTYNETENLFGVTSEDLLIEKKDVTLQPYTHTRTITIT